MEDTAVYNMLSRNFLQSVESGDCDQLFWLFQSSSKNFETTGNSGFDTANICF